MNERRGAALDDSPGLPARRLAAEALTAILHRRRQLDEVLDLEMGIAGLSAILERDRALVRMLVATSLRRLGTLRAVLDAFLEHGLPKNVPRVESALLLGAAQLLFLSVPDHAAVDLSVRLAAEDRVGQRYSGLVNAVLRRIAQKGRERLSTLDLIIDTPAWLYERWARAYGPTTARAIATAHAVEPALDLTVKQDSGAWAERLGGRLLPTGSVRLLSHGHVTALPGYEEGAWWVQDAAAALPARLLGEVKGLEVADLCAAPGGKTAQLALAGARVIAVDRSEPRLKRLKTNLARLRLNAETVLADVAEWRAGPFDAVLLDAPCSATGTIRRHPDVPWRRGPEDLVTLADLQARLLESAGQLVRPGGLLVYATCSLEPEECAAQIESFLSRHREYARVPIAPAEVGGIEAFVSAAGDLRTLSCHLPDSDTRMAGCDGFYAARLRRA